jgi:hypothetical protein
MQNRESAVRSRQKKKENAKYLENEIDLLKKENYRLHYDNVNLRNEKTFLIDQIKFMQNLIRNNNMPLGNVNNKNGMEQENIQTGDIEKNIPQNQIIKNGEQNNESGRNIFLNGMKQRPIRTLFSVCVIYVLSLSYVSYGSSGSNEGRKIIGGPISDGFRVNSFEEELPKPNNNMLLTFLKFIGILLILSIIFILTPWYDKAKNYLCSKYKIPKLTKYL